MCAIAWQPVIQSEAGMWLELQIKLCFSRLDPSLAGWLQFTSVHYTRLRHGLDTR